MSETIQKWIEAGYELFSKTGPKNFKIEQLSKEIGLNKSGFYHHFSSRELFFIELMKYHDQMGEKFAQELSGIKNFMPGYQILLIKYITSLQVHIHLRKNLDETLFKEYFFKVKNRNYKYQLPLWATYIQISDMQMAAELFEIAVDLMVLRLESDVITFDYLQGIFEGVRHTVEKLRSGKGTLQS